MLLVKLLLDYYRQQVWKQENKAKTNPGKNVSRENGTYGHSVRQLGCASLATWGGMFTIWHHQGHVQAHTGAQRFATVSGLNYMFPGNGVQLGVQTGFRYFFSCLVGV